MRKLAKKLNIDLSIKPGLGIPDDLNHQNIIIFWRINHEVCPFLKDNNCLIYEYRPIICKYFPIKVEEKINKNKMNFFRFCLMGCSQLDYYKRLVEIVPSGSFEQGIKNIYAVFGQNTIAAAFQDFKMQEWIFKMMDSMEEKGLIKRGQTEKEKDIGLVRLMVDSSFATNEEILKLGNDLYNLADGKKEVEKIINPIK